MYITGLTQYGYVLSECELTVCQDRASLVRSSPEGRFDLTLQNVVFAVSRPVTPKNLNCTRVLNIIKGAANGRPYVSVI